MSDSAPFAILRVKPLRSWPAVSAMARHGRRVGDDMDHLDRSRSSLNQYGSPWGDPTDLRACMQAVMTHHGVTLRKGSPLGSHLLLTASAGYFRPNAPDAMGTWDQARLDTWLEANLRWVNERWPDQVAAWRLDLDEATPHLDCFLVPVHRRKTKTGKVVIQVSHRNAFGTSRKSFALLQNDYATVMQPLGLRRGRPRSVTAAVHVHPAELRRRMAIDADHQRAMKVGLGAIMRRDLRSLRAGPNGSPQAEFSALVPIGQRARLLATCRPAWPLLMRFEREMMFHARRFISDTVTELTTAATVERDEARRAVDEASIIIDMLRAAGRAPALEAEYRLAALVRQLAR